MYKHKMPTVDFLILEISIENLEFENVKTLFVHGKANYQVLNNG